MIPAFEGDLIKNIDQIKINTLINNWEVEIRRGSIVLLVLAALSQRDLHGIALIEDISNKTKDVVKIPLGTVYPLLRRFNRDRLIETYKLDDDARKTMYRINSNGKVFFIRARELWLRYSSAVNLMLEYVDEKKLTGDVN